MFDSTFSLNCVGFPSDVVNSPNSLIFIPIVSPVTGLYRPSLINFSFNASRLKLLSIKLSINEFKSRGICDASDVGLKVILVGTPP